MNSADFDKDYTKMVERIIHILLVMKTYIGTVESQSFSTRRVLNMYFNICGV